MRIADMLFHWKSLVVTSLHFIFAMGLLFVTAVFLQVKPTELTKLFGEP